MVAIIVLEKILDVTGDGRGGNDGHDGGDGLAMVVVMTVVVEMMVVLAEVVVVVGIDHGCGDSGGDNSIAVGDGFLVEMMERFGNSGFPLLFSRMDCPVILH